MRCGCAYSRWLAYGHRRDCPEMAALARQRPYPLPPVTTRVPQPYSYRVQAVDHRGRFTQDPVPPYNRGRTRIDAFDPAPSPEEIP